MVFPDKGSLICPPRLSEQTWVDREFFEEIQLDFGVCPESLEPTTDMQPTVINLVVQLNLFASESVECIVKPRFRRYICQLNFVSYVGVANSIPQFNIDLQKSKFLSSRVFGKKMLKTEQITLKMSLFLPNILKSLPYMD